MSIHNKVSVEIEIPNLVKMNEVFTVFDDAAKGFKEATEAADPRLAAKFLQGMTRLDHFFADHRLEV